MDLTNFLELLNLAPAVTAAAILALSIAMGRLAFQPVAEPRYRLRRDRPSLRAITGRALNRPATDASDRDAA